MIQIPLFPMYDVSISQRAFGGYSHKTLEAIDINGKDTGIQPIFAPCRVKVLAVLEKSKTGFNNTVLVGTCDSSGRKTAVLCADGTSQVLTFGFTHDNDISDIKVGTVIDQFTEFYHEGTKGQATGNHGHLEIGLGWQYRKYKDNNGNWCLKNLISCEKVFWLMEGKHTICNRGLNGYSFPWTADFEEVEVEDTMQFKLIKGSYAGKKYPTRSTSKGKYSTAYPVVVGDMFNVDEVVADGKYWIGHMVDGPQKGRWIELDPGYFEQVGG